MADRYTHGHHESVLRSHRWRTAENSAAHLLPTLRPGLDLLDVGCGPGTITADLAQRVAPGLTVGLDAAFDVVRSARADLAGTAGPVFCVGDAYHLGFSDATFDVVHAHQVLQHLTRPVDALAEMGRVLRPGGRVAVRDADFGAFAWAPSDPLLDRWLALYHEVTAANGAEADAGRHLPAWTRAAGLAPLQVTSSTWTFADPDSRRWWGGLWADRITQSAFAEQATTGGLSDPEELAAIATAWRRWAEAEDAMFVVPHVEVVASR